MITLATLDPASTTEQVLDALERDGACIVRDLLPGALRRRVQDELEPFVAATGTGRDDFAGRQTVRTGALVARSPACRELVMNESILTGARTFLAPYSEKILLHLTQVIRLLPGQGGQMLHRDRLAWGKYLPPGLEPQFNAIWAFTDFTDPAMPENHASDIRPPEIAVGRKPREPVYFTNEAPGQSARA